MTATSEDRSGAGSPKGQMVGAVDHLSTLFLRFAAETDTAPDALVGMGVGLTFGPSATAAIESAPREQAGIAAGTNSMMRYLGSIVGAGPVMSARRRRNIGTRVPSFEA